MAQDREGDPELEALIPDAAIDNPEAWAREGEDALAEAEVEALASTEILTDPSLSEIDLALPDIDLPAVETDPAIDFAELDIGRPQIDFAGAETIRVSDNLLLGFPQKTPPFDARGDFVERFKALSTIVALGGGDDQAAQLGARAREDADLLAELLQVYGFYDAEVVRTPVNSGGEEGKPAVPQVRFDVIPGERYRFGAIDLGQLASAPDGELLRKQFEIAPGDFLQSDTIVDERFDLDRALGESGYPFAAIEEPNLLIDHDRVEGDLTMIVQPGGKYVFGEVTSSDPALMSGRHLGRIARFEPGDTYQRSLQLDLRRAVTATGLVASVTITPRETVPPSGSRPGVVAMDVGLERAKLRTVAGAIGYGTEEGFRIQASWEHRNLFPPEGLLRVRGILGTREQLAGVTFRKNNFRARDQVLTLDAYASTVDSEAFDANTVALSALFERTSTLLFQKPLSWGFGAELLATDERNRVTGGIPRPRRAYFIAAASARATIDTSDSLLDPTRGFRIGGFVGPEIARSEGRQFTYLRGQIDGSYYLPVGERTVVAGRARLASVMGAELVGVAPSRRLYAGGGASVRGYGYQSIGPRDELGDPLGGRSLVEASLEARIGTGFLGGAVSIVPFVDAGSVSISSTPDFSTIKFGAGVGLRYATGFGPIRVDVGIPLNPDPDDAAVGVYVSLGQAF